MFTHQETLTAIPNRARVVRLPTKSVMPSIHRGDVSLTAEFQHVSLIVYAVPAERVRALLPAEFDAEVTISNGRQMGWVSVESFFDPNGGARSAFEQTAYRLHALRDGEPCRWLLGLSLGSLAAVGARNLWALPWHLGAMEFRAAYSSAERRYHAYGLQSQSEWANAKWRIEDSGEWISPRTIEELPTSLRDAAATDYFARRDGPPNRVGCQRTRTLDPLFTRGRLKFGQCDLLERLGLLDGEEIKHPRLAALQHRLCRQLKTPSTVELAATAKLF